MKKSNYQKINSRARKQIGSSGEIRALNYFKEKGFEVVETNFRCRSGEVDLIVSKDEILVFVEVKTLLWGNLEVLARELNSEKQKRILETSKYFLSKHRQYSNSLVRFDVVVIDMPGFPAVYHIENAFLEFS